MSLKTWKEKHYNIRATQVLPEDAVEHGLRKWEGLDAKTLKEHGLELDYIYLIDINSGDTLPITGSTCSLCRIYIDYAGENRCSKCPLFEILGEPCDDNPTSPYSIFLATQDPQPMIEALKQCM